MIKAMYNIAMKYRGYQLTVSCAAWEQLERLGEFWDYVAEKTGMEKIVGLGYGWKDDQFNYAVGVIDDEETLAKLRAIDFENGGFAPKYIEIELPEMGEWTEYTGEAKKLREIYETQIDCYDRKYDYELEFFDSAGNVKILIHYVR